MRKECRSVPAIILINLPGESVRTPEEHCGIAYLHAYLKSNKIDATILDAYALRLSINETFSIVEKWILARPKLGRVWVGISPFVTSHDNFVWLGEKIHEEFPNVTIIAGGHYACLNKEHMLAIFSWLDGIIVGEGEQTLLQVVQGKINTPGYFSRQTKDHFIPRPRITDLDKLPNQTRYLTPAQLSGQPFALSTSRGCYGNCKFCSIASFYKCNSPNIKQTSRSAESVYDEIMFLHKKYGAVNFKIIDDNFFRVDGDNFLRILSNKLRDKNFSFRLSSRPDDINDERAMLLSQMGVKIIALGVESANENLLKWINKGTCVQDSIEAVETLDRHDIACLANFIMFLPIMSLDELSQNYEFVRQLSKKAIFHRLDSHLWLRATDPIATELIEEGLSDGYGFPYIVYRYRYESVARIYAKFAQYCIVDMKKYYSHVDRLMAHGVIGFEGDFQLYQQIIKRDLDVLGQLIQYERELQTI